jgi:solute carrier family 25 oxoglutarate transporter 11
MSAAAPTKPSTKPIPGWVNFAVGGLSGMMSTMVVQPVDLLKTRMQLQGGADRSSLLTVFRTVLKNEGVLAMYNGYGIYRRRLRTIGRRMISHCPHTSGCLPVSSDKPPTRLHAWVFSTQ